ncbi:MAG: FKBP-type peptidyl-prolyl cis-trans isomerase [Bacteroidales bacterium]|nr:FKBP-type peptidyl-prolyl cis-trans isomerase [Bacteroidales bacterium]
MMKTYGFILIASIVIGLSACNQGGVEKIKVETKEDSLAYAIGVLNNEGLSGQGLELDAMMMAKGMIEAAEGNPIFNETMARGYYTLYMQGMQEEQMREQFTDVIEESESFLEENAKREGVKVTESGLQYEVITEGNGPKPGAEDKVKVHYTGTLVNGTKFDSSVDRGEPIEFTLNGVIAGWTEGLQLMPVGSTYKLYIPYELGYGTRGAGQDIPPYAALIFEVELLDITTGK